METYFNDLAARVEGRADPGQQRGGAPVPRAVIGTR